MTSRHAALTDATGFWRQFVTTFYFDTAGAEVAGTLLWYGPANAKADDAPQIRIQTREGRVHEITATQERLKAELVRLEPAQGDRLRIVYTGEAEKAAPGMSKAKLFTVEIRRQGPQSQERPNRTSGEEETALSENGPGTGELVK